MRRLAGEGGKQSELDVMGNTRAHAAKLPECLIQGKRRSSTELALCHGYGMLSALRVPTTYSHRSRSEPRI